MNIRESVATWLLSALLFAASAAAQTYTVTDLGVQTGYNSSWAIFINSSGQITGCSDSTTTQSNICAGLSSSAADLWSDGKLKNIGALKGDNSTAGYFISDSGDIVGYSDVYAENSGHAFLWTPTGGMKDLGTLPGGKGYSVADAMTSTGVIVGESVVANGDVHGVLWVPKGTAHHIEDIGILPGAPYTYPYAINESQQVVGIAYFNEAGTQYHAVSWSQASGWKDLGTLAGKGNNSWASWNNNKGVAVGVSTSKKYPNGVAVSWNSAGKIETIGTLPGGTSSFAGFINDAGEILGESLQPDGFNHAFTWSPKNHFQDLNDLIPSGSGWLLNHASCMNASGQIVGYGTINGATHGFLLTPVPAHH
jgi:probable HAF family extracellular repeat protein